MLVFTWKNEKKNSDEILKRKLTKIEDSAIKCAANCCYYL